MTATERIGLTQTEPAPPPALLILSADGPAGAIALNPAGFI